MNKDELVKKLPFWNMLNNEEAELVKMSATINKYPKGVVAQGFEDECLGVIQVLKGQLRVYLLSEEGREVTLFRINEGEFCTLTASCIIEQITFETQISAEADTELLVINAGTYERLADSNLQVKCFTYELIIERFSEIMWALQQILFMGFDKRLAVFLYDEYSRTGSLEIKMTHEQIAKLTGSAREVVSRMLKRFADEDIVEFKRGVIIIKNIAALKKIIK
ncbi:MAG: Crp/Fnr family transcriptional regulator [Papillibacter sp.]|nr:Crp/Fnr family transcriptional regulator [Papillibacter sp.]